MELLEHYEIKDNLLDSLPLDGEDLTDRLQFVFTDEGDAVREFERHQRIADRYDVNYTGRIERHTVVRVAEVSEEKKARLPKVDELKRPDAAKDGEVECPECGKPAEVWQDVESWGYQCQRTDCGSFDVLGRAHDYEDVEPDPEAELFS